ncbi:MULTISPECIES: 3-deoxy-D-manno-octulosonic acid transferase [unclassified Fibrobacter]|uniref:3-deoxy-D-manno-octulosonic acid transferase n=1 Tax=unclassified Fibrobacter TaxID=2634177 RepID=UPI000D6CBB4B|nr:MULTISPECIES: glycosyltransferase N-terminal domain-containing protein [unclassified Fibrobacter]PWJ62758.1 3-deoxy-D-manno-octulosonic-acid transferase [Fibrobacter sp. UWR4]PZW66860.1 3-deoxy-D-manno-octulosonic-acid transferase [Fibrobacter sp. UWR1]
MMGLNFINLGRIALGLVAEIASRVKPLEKKYCISRRLRCSWPKGPFLWMHGASMGECKMLLDLATALQEDVSDLPKILLTSQKVEVVRYLQKSQKSCDVALAPADVPWVLRKFLRCVKPVGLILGENELWPGYLSAMERYTKSPSVALVSGRFRKAVPGMKFSGIGFAAVQTFDDQNRLLKAAMKSFRAPICKGGNWKLLNWARGDQTENVQDFNEAGSVRSAYTSFISLHVEELPFLRKTFSRLVKRNKTIVLVPRRLEETRRMERFFRGQGVPVVQWPAVAPGTISIVNSFGKVKEILSQSDFAFVGGSFHKSLGIHDFWEPLRMGVPTFVGPFCRGAESAVKDLVKNGGLVRLKNSNAWPQIPADRACVESLLAKEREKILNSYRQLKKFVEELLK